jgi:hypothetical protein
MARSGFIRVEVFFVMAHCATALRQERQAKFKLLTRSHSIQKHLTAGDTIYSDTAEAAASSFATHSTRFLPRGASKFKVDTRGPLVQRSQQLGGLRGLIGATPVFSIQSLLPHLSKTQTEHTVKSYYRRSPEYVGSCFDSVLNISAGHPKGHLCACGCHRSPRPLLPLPLPLRHRHQKMNAAKAICGDSISSFCDLICGVR